MILERGSVGRGLKKLSEAISADLPIEWESIGAATPTARRRIDILRQLAELRNAHRAIADDFDRGGTQDSGLFSWGHLVVLEKVGEGGFGEVYRAMDSHLLREVALKLRREDVDDPSGGNRRFLEEARHLARVRHSNILVVHGADIHNGRAGLWTDFVRGQTLAHRLAEMGPLGLEETAQIGVALCRALAAVHAAGLVHQDVKASNVMREEHGRILLMDFGSVRRVAPGGPERGWEPSVGTPLSVAPEVLLGHAPPTPRSDIYSLGVLIFQLITGRYPVPSTTWADLLARHERGGRLRLAELRPDLPVAFTELIEAALAPDPSARPASAQELERALIAAVPEAVDPSERRQSLRMLLDDLGRVPEPLCRRIAGEIARTLMRSHESGRPAGLIDVAHIWLRPDCSVEIDPNPTAGSGETSPAAAQEVVEGDLRRLGAVLLELTTGRPAAPMSPGQSRVAPGDRRAPDEDGALVSLDPLLSPFLRRLLVSICDRHHRNPIHSARDLVQILAEAETGAWWREERRALRRAQRLRRQMPVARETTLHGRTAELDRLRAAFVDCAAGRGRVVILEGEAGIGKTRLVHELVASLESEGRELNFLFGSYPPGGATASGAFQAAYREHMGDDDLLDAVAEHLQTAPLLIPSFAALLRGTGTPEDSLTNDSVQTAFVHVTRSIAREVPTIVFIDDLHFSPEEGRSLFTALALAVPSDRVLLIGGTRSMVLGSWEAELTRLEHCIRIPLGRLSRESASGMLAEALKSEAMADTLGPLLAERADGNPLFLLEHLRTLQELGYLWRDADGQWAMSAEATRPVIPSSIEHVIQARLAALPDEDQELLDVAACCGFEFDPTLVAEVLGLETVQALRRFAFIERRTRLVSSLGDGYVFDHHQVQRALYSGLFAPLRRRYHAEIAAALERRTHASGGVDGATAVQLCDQFFRGGRGAEGLRFLQSALAHLGTLQPGRAERLVCQALETPDLVVGRDRVDLLTRRAGLLFLLGRRHEEEESLNEMLAQAESLAEPQLRSQARRMLGFFLSRSGRAEDARQVLEEARNLAGESGDLAEQSKVLQITGRTALDQGRPEDALRAYAASLDLARRSGQNLLEGQLLGSMGVAYMGLRRFDEARECLEGALQSAIRQGSRTTELIAVGNLGAVLLDAQRFDEALPYLEDHLRRAQATGIRLGELYAQGNLGEIFAHLGWTGRALDRLSRAIAIAKETGSRVPESHDLTRLAAVHTILGRWDDARSALEHSLSISEESGNRRIEGFGHLGLGQIAEHTGELDLALERYESARAAWTAASAPECLDSCFLRRGSILRRKGLLDEARSELEAALVRGREFRFIPTEALALAELAMLPGGRTEELVATLPEWKPRLPIVNHLEIRAQLWQATGDPAHLDEAKRLLSFLQENAPDEDRVAMIHRVSVYRQVEAEWKRVFSGRGPADPA